MSAIDCVDSCVLTRLSPSPPCGRVCILILMVGFLASNALISASVGLTDPSLLSTRYDSVTFPPAPPPPLSEPHATTASASAHAAATVVTDFHDRLSTIPAHLLHAVEPRILDAASRVVPARQAAPLLSSSSAGP